MPNGNYAFIRASSIISNALSTPVDAGSAITVRFGWGETRGCGSMK